MKTIKTEIKLYEYKELKEKAKEFAFNKHLSFLYQNPSTYEEEDENGNITIKYDDLDKWTEEEIKQKEEIIKYIRECDKTDFYDLFEECRNRHNNFMLN